MCRQLQHNSGRLSGGVTADYVLQLKGSANDEPNAAIWPTGRALRRPSGVGVWGRIPTMYEVGACRL
jgi:hypothetical protein